MAFIEYYQKDAQISQESRVVLEGIVLISQKLNFIFKVRIIPHFAFIFISKDYMMRYKKLLKRKK